MAFYVPMERISETPTEVQYAFGAPDGQRGVLKLDKQTGRVEELVTIGAPNPQAHFQRARAKAWQHWERGEFPERTSWMS